MTNWTRKLFSLGELKYGWLLLLSVAICAVTYYADEYYDPDNQLWLSVGYFAAGAMAIVWGGANYIGHIRMNGLYRKQHNIPAYVEQLAMSGEDKLELRNYLEDFAADLESQGKTAEEAAKEAIAQFKVKEFLSMSKHTRPFESHGHHYLLGWAILIFAAAAVIGAIDYALNGLSLYLFIAKTVLAVYGAGFVALYVLSKTMDALVYRKLEDYWS